MNTLSNLTAVFKARQEAGENTFKAARSAESAEIAEFKKGQRAVMDAMSMRMSRAIRAKDRSAVLKNIHAASTLLNSSAEEVNLKLAAFAAAISPPNSRGKAWTSKVQHAIVVKVKLGEKSGMTGEAGFEDEWKGFDGTAVNNLLMSLTKEDWHKRASRQLVERIQGAIASWFEVRDGAVEDAVDVPVRDRLTSPYGGMAYKTTWKALSKVAFKAALFDAYAEVVYEFGKPVGVTSKKLERLRERIQQDEMGKIRVESDPYGYSAPVAGDHYAEVRVDELAEEEYKLLVWETAHEMWASVAPLVEEYNLIQLALAASEGEAIQMPTPKLPDPEVAAKATLARLEAVAAEPELAEAMARLTADKEAAMAAFADLTN